MSTKHIVSLVHVQHLREFVVCEKLTARLAL